MPIPSRTEIPQLLSSSPPPTSRTTARGIELLELRLPSVPSTAVRNTATLSLEAHRKTTLHTSCRACRELEDPTTIGTALSFPTVCCASCIISMNPLKFPAGDTSAGTSGNHVVIVRVEVLRHVKSRNPVPSPRLREVRVQSCQLCCLHSCAGQTESFRPV